MGRIWEGWLEAVRPCDYSRGPPPKDNDCALTCEPSQKRTGSVLGECVRGRRTRPGTSAGLNLLYRPPPHKSSEDCSVPGGRRSTTPVQGARQVPWLHLYVPAPGSSRSGTCGSTHLRYLLDSAACTLYCTIEITRVALVAQVQVVPACHVPCLALSDTDATQRIGNWTVPALPCCREVDVSVRQGTDSPTRAVRSHSFPPQTSLCFKVPLTLHPGP